MKILPLSFGTKISPQHEETEMSKSPQSYESRKFYSKRDDGKSSSYPDDTNPTEVTDSHCLLKFPPNGRLEDVLDCYGKWKAVTIFLLS